MEDSVDVQRILSLDRSPENVERNRVRLSGFFVGQRRLRELESCRRRARCTIARDRTGLTRGHCPQISSSFSSAERPLSSNVKRWRRCRETECLDGCAFRADGRPTDQQVYLVPSTPAMSGSGVLVDGVAREKMAGERESGRC